MASGQERSGVGRDRFQSESLEHLVRGRNRGRDHRQTAFLLDDRHGSHESARLRGDLDWISMKALDKDRNLRDETASEFGQDVQRLPARRAGACRTT